ncbi:MAG: hypothetical protein M1820_007950 [Bogoriella megaspora]|nr:MAG: hypothetical protein M1820_007950 [Bogoriella megaspora]
MASAKLLSTVESVEELAQSLPKQLREDDGLRKRLLDAVQKIVPEIETPPETSQRLLYTPCELVGARIGVDLDLFNTLAQSDKPLQTEELARKTGTEPELLSRLLKYMSSVGLVKENGADKWSSSNAGKNVSIRTSTAGVRFFHESLTQAYLALPSWLKRRGYTTPTEMTDAPFAQGHGAPPEQSFFAWLQAHPSMAMEFNIFMGAHRVGARTWLDKSELVALINEAHDASKDQDRAFFVDVGGGIGQQCEALNTKLPGLKGRIILEDLPKVVEKAKLSDGIEAVGMDFFQEQPVKGATAYYMRSVLRNWPDKACRTILQHTRDAMDDRSLLLIDEIILSDSGASKEETQLDMTMLAVLNAQARTASHWKKLLNEAGLELQDIVLYQDAGREAVVVGRLPKGA